MFSLNFQFLNQFNFQRKLIQQIVLLQILKMRWLKAYAK